MDFLAQMVQFWQVLQNKIRESLPQSCLDAMGSMKGTGGGEHEMGTYATNEQTQEFEAVYDEATGEFVQRPKPQQVASSGEFDEFGGCKITEWEAGWNVTNAIQVNRISP